MPRFIATAARSQACSLGKEGAISPATAPAGALMRFAPCRLIWGRNVTAVRPQAGSSQPRPARKHISSSNLLVAGVKGPLHLRGERQMNPGLKQGTCFFSPPPDAPPPAQGLFIMSFNSQLRVGGSNKTGEIGGEKAPLSGERPQPWCVKREGSVGIRDGSFMGRT